MAVLTQTLSLTSSLKLTRDTDSDATSESNINSGAATLYLIQIDNSANASQKVFWKAYNNTAPTVGTTAPDLVIPVAGGATVRCAIAAGIVFGTGLSFATVLAGGTANTSSPTNDVAVALVYA